MPTVGVLSCPKSWLELVWAQLSSKTEEQKGYIVDAHWAIEILASHAPDAANWWREHAPAAIRQGRRFLFAAEACQEVVQ